MAMGCRWVYLHPVHVSSRSTDWFMRRLEHAGFNPSYGMRRGNAPCVARSTNAIVLRVYTHAALTAEPDHGWR
jgi:hypothetical protein